MATLVKFVNNNPFGIVAIFPQLKYSRNPMEQDILTCYAHIGQHSACHIDYANECKEATPEQYADLKTELESIGYKLQIV